MAKSQPQNCTKKDHIGTFILCIGLTPNLVPLLKLCIYFFVLTRFFVINEHSRSSGSVGASRACASIGHGRGLGVFESKRAKAETEKVCQSEKLRKLCPKTCICWRHLLVMIRNEEPPRSSRCLFYFVQIDRLGASSKEEYLSQFFLRVLELDGQGWASSYPYFAALFSRSSRSFLFFILLSMEDSTPGLFV